MSEKNRSTTALVGNPGPIVYKGMTVNQLTDAYDDYKAIPNLDALLQENRERAQIVKARLSPIQDIAYGTEAIQKLDIYAPKNAKKMPVLISIHGGGWTMGSKNPWAIPAEILMSKDIISVSIDYGLAPQYRMEDIIAHVRYAVAWVYKNIAQYGGDPNRLYIYGMSAGAHLASTALMLNWHKDFGLPEDVIKGLISLSGIYDLCTLVYAPQADSQKALQMTLEESRRDSPLYHLPKHSIPAIIAYGEKEPLILYHLEANNYAQVLQKAGCHVSLIEVPDANHFDMINELANTEGRVFKAVMQMVTGYTSLQLNNDLTLHYAQK
jgi:arylformamidase